MYDLPFVILGCRSSWPEICIPLVETTLLDDGVPVP